MREIKFRAWDKVRKEFLSAGNLFISVNPRRNPKSSDIYLDVIKDPNQYNHRFEIMQYTGLKDKNGKEIYEGDIVKDDSGLFGNVVYSSEEYDGIAGFMVFDVYDGLQNVDGFWHLVEVIGNIYENPELLEGGSHE